VYSLLSIYATNKPGTRVFSLHLQPHIRDVAQPGSALAWGARGRKFESCRPDKKRTIILRLSFLVFLASGVAMQLS
jgi:hypothetical protein